MIDKMYSSQSESVLSVLGDRIICSKMEVFAWLHFSNLTEMIMALGSHISKAFCNPDKIRPFRALIASYGQLKCVSIL